MQQTPPLSLEDAYRPDDYLGRYKEASQLVSQADQWGLLENPVQHDRILMKNMRVVGCNWEPPGTPYARQL